jgi:indole-3-glycerol phosphate synthase
VILDEIVAYKRLELVEQKRQVSLAQLKDSPLFSSPPRPFRSGLAGWPGRAIIAEVKKASPSRGVIRQDCHHVDIARAYARHGAAAISVLTEAKYFQGSLDYLREIRAHVTLPLLRKDFLFDPYQLYEARAQGADAVLLIAAILADGELGELLALVASLDLDALVEVHDQNELERALACGATLVGTNNRNLRTFHTTLETTETLVRLVPAGVTVVSESGFSQRTQLEKLERLGVRAFLIGETLMAAPDPGEKLVELLEKEAASDLS